MKKKLWPMKKVVSSDENHAMANEKVTIGGKK
jgi:hypothetical protein